jgi:cysteine-rich repeat protein
MKRAVLLAVSTAIASLALHASELHAQVCPAGRTCFYVPPGMPIPTGFSGIGWDMVLAAPRGTITGTWRIGLAGMPRSFSVSPGTPVIFDLGTDGAATGIATAYNAIQSNGIFVEASSGELIVDHREIRGPWQSSSTIKSSSYSLGTRFRAAGYALNQTNNPDTGHDYISVYAPTGATVTFTAPPGASAPFWDDGIAGLTHSVTLTAGQTYMIRSRAGCTELHGALVTSTDPISAESGGRGWSGGSGACAVGGGCGDDGADHLIPVTGLGTQYVTDDYPSSGPDGERVHVIADVDNTEVRVNGTLVATLMAGQRHTFSPSGLQYIETSVNAYVYEESGLASCETDIAAIPPVVLAPIGTWQTDFNVVGSGQCSVVIATANVASFRLSRGATALTPSATTVVPGRPDLTRLRFTGLPDGNFSARANGDFQLGLVTAAGGTGLFAYYTPFRIPGCGDGTVGASEGCDDGNLENGDGCSDGCRIEVGSPITCAMTPQCVPTGRCEMGRCVSRCMTTMDCDDRDECTADTCTLATGICSNAARPRGTTCAGGSCGLAVVGDNIVCVPFANDLDRDGVADAIDADDDNDGLPDALEGNADPDGDMIPNARDLDADGDGVFDIVESGSAPRDADRDGRVDSPIDADGDGLASVFDRDDASRSAIASTVTPSNTDERATAPAAMADTIPDYLDGDDDGDGILTRDELGTGGAASPRNTDAAPPAGSGTSDTVPDYLDTDDDGDGIPTAVERPLEGMTPGDADPLPAWLDFDSDGDGISDRLEAGATPIAPINTDMMDRPDFLDTDSDNDTVLDRVEAGADPLRPTNTDGDSVGPDFLDTDSDNDCVPDSDPSEAGAARTDPAMPRAMVNANCMDPALPICSTMLGRCVSDMDTDGDGVPNLVEARLGTNPMNPDSDMDGVPDGAELGAGPAFMSRDTDMDGTIDALDNDDDSDGIPTRDELGDPMSPRNSNAMVPSGEGTANTLPDYLDADDDGDGIPTRVERTLEGDTAGDGDGTAAHLDRDADGDNVPDALERGMNGATPANTDGADRADFLDSDSDNDCVPDADPREAAAARTDATMPQAVPDRNCAGETPVCDTAAGRCVVCTDRMGVGAGCESSMAGRACLRAMSMGTETRTCGCAMDSDCASGARCDSMTNRCVPRPAEDAGADASIADASAADANRPNADAGASMDGGAMDGGPAGVSGTGACGCRVPGGPTGDDRGIIALALAGAAALFRAGRRRR